MVKNIGFLIKHVPFAAKKAEAHFNKAIELMNEIGAKGLIGPAYLSLAKFYIATKRSEEVKEITCRIFGEVSRIVAGYDGFIEKYAGDAVMAIFGVPNAHEDDPVRAVKAAREIHQAVDAIKPGCRKEDRLPHSHAQRC